MTEPAKIILTKGDTPSENPAAGKLALYPKTDGLYFLDEYGVEKKLDEGVVGAGDTISPVSNTDSYIPQWDGTNSKTLKNGLPISTFAPALVADENYVTDAEKVIIGNTSGTNTGDDAANSNYSSLVSNATHTGEVTGDGALTVEPTAISNKTLVTAVGADHVLIVDATDGALKKALISDFASGGGGGGGMAWSLTAIDASATTLHGYLINASAGAINLTLPATPSEGDSVGFCDAYDMATTNVITIARNGSNIEGSATDLTIDVDGAGAILVYADATRGWEIISEIGGGANYVSDGGYGVDWDGETGVAPSKNAVYDEMENKITQADAIMWAIVL